MLNTLRALYAYHLQALKHGFNVLSKKPVATLMTALVIAIALALPAFFWVLTDNVARFTIDWQRGGHISVYLKPQSQAQQSLVLQKMRTLQGVGQASLKSAEQGLSELVQQEGMQDIMRYLPENPLPAVIEIVPALAVDTPAKLEGLAKQLQRVPEIDSVKLDMEWITRLHAVLHVLGHASNALMALLALAVVLIIGTTLRLTIHSREEEIQILKLIGASDPFIVRPFLYSGAIYGLLGAILAVLMVNLIMLSLGVAINQLAVAYQMHYPLNGLDLGQVLLLMAFAVILGWSAAHLSVKRQLLNIEPYK